ncbi:MAG: hypothetical protein AB7F19_05035 [Candidatus Babeliales bacterium]
MKLQRNELCKALILFLISNYCSAVENQYTFKNNSFLEIKVSVWFTKSLEGKRPENGEARRSSTGAQTGAPAALPLPDFQLILQPQENEVLAHLGSHVKEDECLAYLMAEYRIIPTLKPSIKASGLSTDLFLVGKRFWAQKLPGLCGANLIELNYDPASYLKFSITINGVEDEFKDVHQTNEQS